MKTHILIIITFLFYSCSKEDDNSQFEIENQNTVPELVLKSQNQTNIFEKHHFMFDIKEKINFGEYDYFIERISLYDSIIVSISGIDKKLAFFKKDSSFEKGYFITNDIKHYFEKPGTYTSYIKGYQKDLITYIDSLKIAVNNDKDILNANWGDIYNGEIIN